MNDLNINDGSKLSLYKSSVFAFLIITFIIHPFIFDLLSALNYLINKVIKT